MGTTWIGNTMGQLFDTVKVAFTEEQLKPHLCCLFRKDVIVISSKVPPF